MRGELIDWIAFKLSSSLYAPSVHSIPKPLRAPLGPITNLYSLNADNYPTLDETFQIETKFLN